MASTLKLPEESEIAFRNLKDAKLLAMDIGGSLTKIAYYSTVPQRKIIYDSETISSNDVDECTDKIEVIGGMTYKILEGARLHFIKFETSQIEKCLDYVRATLMSNKDGPTVSKTVSVTGGGAYKFADLIKEKLQLQVSKSEEIECICSGANFLLKNIVDESFLYDRSHSPSYKFITVNPSDLYPFLLVTIGSGVSVIKILSEDSYERIGGTATGGGTFWGLGKLLTKAEGFDELLELATQGDFRNVDMLVKDIYGERGDVQTSLGLSPTTIASTFGKAIQIDKSGKRPFTDADVARSLLYLVSNDVGQIATLYAMLHKIKTVYFGGFFLRHHPVSLHTVSYAVNYWSKGEVQARFLRHEGYLGAIGAFLKGAEPNQITDEYSWTENLYGSSSFVESLLTTRSEDHLQDNTVLEVTDHLEIDRYETPLVSCPLLNNPAEYNADTVDLGGDKEAMEYWLKCFEESLPKFTERALESQAHSKSALERSELFKNQFLSRLQILKTNPFAHGNLTVRSLLDMREHCLNEFDFHDPYWKQKRVENDAALQLLPDRLEYLDSLEREELQIQLVIGMLAGNVFDWGAKEVALLMEGNNLDFNQALKLVGPRPWLVDDFSLWVERLNSKNGPHKCAAIFIDNSGVDVVLGILPLVIDFLKRGTSVLLCANNRPVLNDVTYAELTVILQRAAKLNHVLAQGLVTGRLQCINSGQSSPCLDLSRLSKILVDVMVDNKVDLIVLEGMGRAIHTNLYAKFKCESLKVAVLKNRWLADRLGGGMFSVIFKYEATNFNSSA